MSEEQTNQDLTESALDSLVDDSKSEELPLEATAQDGMGNQEPVTSEPVKPEMPSLWTTLDTQTSAMYIHALGVVLKVKGEGLTFVPGAHLKIVNGAKVLVKN